MNSEFVLFAFKVIIVYKKLTSMIDCYLVIVMVVKSYSTGWSKKKLEPAIFCKTSKILVQSTWKSVCIILIPIIFNIQNMNFQILRFLEIIDAVSDSAKWKMNKKLLFWERPITGYRGLNLVKTVLFFKSFENFI